MSVKRSLRKAKTENLGSRTNNEPMCPDVGCLTRDCEKATIFAQDGEQWVCYNNHKHPRSMCLGTHYQSDNLKFASDISTKAKRNILFIAGSSGCGKTYEACKYIQRLSKIFPDRQVTIFTQSDDHDLYSHFKLDPEIVPIDEALVEEPVCQEELRDNIVLFDDVDSIRNKEIRAEVFDLIERILKLGRKFNIQIVVTYHLLTNYRETRYILSEADYIIVFPNDGSRNQFKRLFETYIGIDSGELDVMKACRARSVVIHCKMPKFFIAGNIVKLLNE